MEFKIRLLSDRCYGLSVRANLLLLCFICTGSFRATRFATGRLFIYHLTKTFVCIIIATETFVTVYMLAQFSEHVNTFKK